MVKEKTNMKKYLFVAVCVLVIAGCMQKQGQTAGDTPQADSVKTEMAVEGKQFTPAEIGNGWAAKDIKVPNGGEQPDIVTLLRAFDKVWPTQSAKLLLGMAADRQSQSINRDTGGGMLIDYNNGFVDVTPGDAPGDILRGAVWKRSNGHRLFGLYLYTPQKDYAGIPDGEALCFYDYDSKTETMTPEKDNAISKLQPSKDNFLRYEFPRMGQDMLVGDSDSEYNTKWHVFAWDGKDFSEETAYTDDELRSAVVGFWKNTDKSLPFSFRITAGEEGWPTITDCGSIADNMAYEAHVLCDNGLMVVSEQTTKGYDDEEEETPPFEPSLVCYFRLTKDGRLTGGYYIKQADGKERKGIMTMEKQNQRND